MKKIAIIDYGAGNLFSVGIALERLGVRVVDDLGSADGVVFPGVGHAGAAMHRLRERGLDDVIRGLRVPTLGICLGMQLMCRRTDEGGVEGLGIFDADVEAFGQGVRVPHVGWNDLLGLRGPLFEGLDESEKVYFVHSYRVPVCDWTIARCDYGGVFSAALMRDNFFGCQFHPEKSAGAGMTILENFLKAI